MGKKADVVEILSDSEDELTERQSTKALQSKGKGAVTGSPAASGNKGDKNAPFDALARKKKPSKDKAKANEVILLDELDSSPPPPPVKKQAAAINIISSSSSPAKAATRKRSLSPSTSGSSSENAKRSKKDKSPTVEAAGGSGQALGGAGIGGITAADRAEMEKARLARAQKNASLQPPSQSSRQASEQPRAATPTTLSGVPVPSEHTTSPSEWNKAPAGADKAKKKGEWGWEKDHRSVKPGLQGGAGGGAGLEQEEQASEEPRVQVERDVMVIEDSDDENDDMGGVTPLRVAEGPVQVDEATLRVGEDEQLARRLQEEEDRAMAAAVSAAARPLRPPPQLHLDPDDPNKKLRFWDGAVKHCPSNLAPSDGYSLRFNAVMGPKEELTNSIIASFTWDPTFIVPHLPADAGRKSIWIAAKGMIGRTPSFIELCEVDKILNEKAHECQHAKFFVLFFDSFCRIVITTANLLPLDWEEQDNSFFIMDFPLRQNVPQQATPPKPSENPTNTGFINHLLFALRQFGVRPAQVWKFSLYDFSASQDVKLVFNKPGKATDGETTFAGQFKDDLPLLSGVVGLATGIRELHAQKAAKGDKWVIEFQSSSVGAMKEQLFRQIACAAAGKLPQSMPSAYDTKQVFDWSHFDFKVVFPAEAYVLNAQKSNFGSGYCHFLTDQTWAGSKFKSWFAAAESKRADDAMIHGKYLTIKHTPAEGVPEAFLYLGSANASAAAWGPISKPARAKDALASNGNNWEMGVLLRVPGITDAELEKGLAERVMFKRPPRKYGNDEIPWIQSRFKRQLM